MYIQGCQKYITEIRRLTVVNRHRPPCLHMWEKFKFTLLDGMQAFIPKGNQCSRNNKKNYQPFIAELKQMIHKNTDY